MYLKENDRISELSQVAGIQQECINSDTNINNTVNAIISKQGVTRYDMHNNCLLKQEASGYGGMLYLPFSCPYKEISITSIREELYGNFCEVIELYRAQNNLVHLKNTVVDDTLPYIETSLQNLNPSILPVGRLCNAHFLGELQYKEAIPELLEAAIYDDDSYMREICMESIGNMHEDSFEYAGNIAKRLYEELDIDVKSSIADTLGKIGNIEIISIMRDYMDELVYLIDSYISQEGHSSINAHKLTVVFQNLLFAIFNLSPKDGREIIPKIYSNCQDEYTQDMLAHFIKNTITLYSPVIQTDIIMPNTDIPKIRELDIEF